MSDTNVNLEERVKELERLLYNTNLRLLRLIFNIEILIDNNRLRQGYEMSTNQDKSVTEDLDNLWIEITEDAKSGS